MTRYERTEIGDNGNRWNLPVRAKWNHSHVGSCYYKPSVWLKSDIVCSDISERKRTRKALDVHGTF